MGDLILSDIKEEILQAECYCIIADETKDLSKKEQMTLALRYLYENEIHEEFLGYIHATSLDAEGLTGFILENLNKWGIAVENCISQSYDGASVMSGVSNGVQARIREHSRWALYIHCYARHLNLVVVGTCKSIREAADYFCHSFAHVQFCERIIRSQ